MCADVVSRAKRSEMMSRIRGKNSKPEVALRKQLFSLGFRYRLHRRDLPGTPDLVLPKHGVALFVHGCFWHRHGCRFTTNPSTNPEFWNAKFQANVGRDQRAIGQLRAAGWRVAIVWECCIGKEGLPAPMLAKLQGWLLSHAARANTVFELP